VKTIHLSKIAALALLALAGAACGAEDSPSEGQNNAGTDGAGNQGDVTSLDSDDAAAGTDVVEHDVPPDTAADVPTTPDIGPGDVTADDGGKPDVTVTCNPGGGGPAGCPCQSNDQCEASKACVDTPKGPRCAKLSSEGGCSGDEKKVAFGAGADAVEICVPKYPKICNPCDGNAQCQSTGYSDAACIDLGDNGGFCGTGCAVNDDCPQGYECAQVKDITGKDVQQCRVKGGAACTCNDYAIQQQYATKCFKSAGAGGAKCAGKRTCLPAGAPNAPEKGGLTSCIALDPAPEECNGKDDDCDGQTDEATCIDKDPVTGKENVCTEDKCEGAAGCKNPNKAGPCDADGSECTKDDKCVDGKCEAGQALKCDDKKECTKDSCDPKKGCVYTPDDGASCNADDNECTVNDTCQDGSCSAGKKKACDAGDQCLEGSCNPITGACKYKAKDGDACNDGKQCTVKDVCKKLSDTEAECKGEGVNCDDQNPCTADSCDPTKGCIKTNIGGACNDNDQCTENDVCTDGACKGKAIDSAKKCDDNNACTDDTCKADLGCVNKVIDGKGCDDGNPCTVGESCTNGVCGKGTNKCACTVDKDCEKQEDGNLCNGTLFCDKSSGNTCKVDPSTIIKCAESSDPQCLTITCDPVAGKCVTMKKPDGLECDADKNACTAGDQCTNGACTFGKVVKCDDGNPCTTDKCDPVKGCTYTNNTDPCDADSSLCTAADKCENGTCKAGTAKVCNDGEDCTKDSCSPADAKCLYVELKQSCDDGNACTEGDACGTDSKTNKYTCIGGKGPNCDDNNPCTADTCDLKSGCKNTIDTKITVPCYTGDPKTQNKGACKDGKRACDSQGKLGKCENEVLPGPKELCDGIDNTCDGVVDEGCAPTGFNVRFANASVAGQGPKWTARATAGASSVAGEAAGTGKYSAYFGFYAWLKKVAGL
jgi:hypothetical protein